MVYLDQIYTVFTFYVHYFPYIVIRRHPKRSPKMPGFHHEMHIPTAPALSIASEMAAISDINYELLHILTSPAVSGTQQILGLDAGVISSLRQLSSSQLRRIAATPSLLMEFFLPLEAGATQAGVAESIPAEHGGWSSELQTFADRALTCLWQSARQHDAAAALRAGLNEDQLQQFATLSFAAIGRFSENARYYLRARHAGHTCFWPDLIRSVNSGSSQQEQAAKLSVIQLSVAQRCRATRTVPVAQRYRTRTG
jgi:hypothetical protein